MAFIQEVDFFNTKIQDISFDEDLIIDNYHSLDNRINVDNCKFKKLFISNFTSKEITFSNCKIDALTIVDFTCNGTILLNCCTFGDITISNGKFRKMELHNVVSTNIKFTGFITNTGIERTGIVFKNANIVELKFEKIDLMKHVDLQAAKIETLSIIKSEIHESFKFGDDIENANNDLLVIDNIRFVSSNFFQRIDFLSGRITDYLWIHKVSFNEQVVLGRRIEMNLLDFIEVYAKYSITVDYDENISVINISDCKFDKSFSVSLYHESELNFNSELTIRINGAVFGNYMFEKLPNVNINISCTNFANILFNKISTNHIIISNFFNYNRLLFNSILLNGDRNFLIIEESTIGDTEFTNVDFNKFDEFVLLKSEVSKLAFTNSKPPKSVQIETKDKKFGYELSPVEKSSRNLYFKEAYRQLKLAMESTGNSHYYLMYKSKEMYYYRKTLKFYDLDMYLLMFNYCSNNHGISWFRGIIFTTMVLVVSFLLLNSQLKARYFYWDLSASYTEIELTFKIAFKLFVKYISTFPKLILLTTEENTWKTDLITFFSRIFVGIGLYQTISAFRKYSK